MPFSIIGNPVYPRYKYDNGQNLDMNLSRRRRYGSASLSSSGIYIAY